jgi:hypothetical protein
MRKTLLAKSIAAVVGAIGLASAAQAVVVLDPGTNLAVGRTAIAAADVLQVNTDSIGHMLAVPYYSVQNNNNTLLNITNTDMLNGKAVKVRFRGAQNSDDVFDFTILMSPGDSWTAAVSRAADGRAQLATADKSCTLPASVNQPFVTARLPGATEADKNAGTREGYVEIFNMADIPPPSSILLLPKPATNPLFTAIKHTAAGVPLDCAAPAVTGLFNIKETETLAVMNTAGLHAPTTGLTASWTLINVPTGAVAWSGNATAVEARTVGVAPAQFLPGWANIVFHPQTASNVSLASVLERTSDPVLRGGVADNDTAAAKLIGKPGVAPIAAASYDFPDFSTPYLNNQIPTLALGVATRQQAFALTRAFALSSVTNEFITTPGLAARTDWVFSSPTRRYNVARNYAGGVPAGSGANLFTHFEFNDADVAVPNLAVGAVVVKNYFTTANTVTQSGVICVKGLFFSGGATDPVPFNLITGVTANREEGFIADSGQFVISPGTPADPLSLCGEVSVLSFNAAGLNSALGGLLTRKDLTVSYTEGWVRIATPGESGAATGLGGSARNGLPVIGAAFTQLTNGSASAGVSANFSQTLPHRGTRY